MKASLWCKVEVRPRNVEVQAVNEDEDEGDDLHLIAPDVRCQSIDYPLEGGRNFQLALPAHTSLHLGCQYLIQFLEPTEQEPKEIVFTGASDTGYGLRMRFRFRAQADQDNKQ